ncbi:14421_t:CDS:2 [Acaulospora morrowiae]|uniref:14421_t:CDS:1 n=1 Tax=Acaulospora morrowiae TaxID=94023 RepID=A0A9N9EU74_9GLOM|nr:14421_t:CDS:2 [Acaulospora morrowiae]
MVSIAFLGNVGFLVFSVGLTVPIQFSSAYYLQLTLFILPFFSIYHATPLLLSVRRPTDPEKAELYDGRRSAEAPTKVQEVSEKIEKTTTELHKSLQELANRGKKLEELEEQTAMLQGSADVFKTRTSQVRKKMWWKNTKMTVILAITAVIILAIIIVPIVLKAQDKI